MFNTVREDSGRKLPRSMGRHSFIRRTLGVCTILATSLTAAEVRGQAGAQGFKATVLDATSNLQRVTVPQFRSITVETTVEVSQGERGMTVLNHLVSPFNLTGQPALTVPCGFTAAGLPIGLQIVGRPFGESVVLAAGYAYQLRTDWHRRTPPVVTT